MLPDRLNRRGVIALIATAAVPLPARAQKPRPKIGFLYADSAEPMAQRLAAFHDGLRDTGHVEGRNVEIEYRWAQGQFDRLPALAAELTRRGVSVLVASPNPAVLAAKAATKNIPIVFQIGSDAVKAGLVASYNHPGGNLTGVSQLSATLGAKRLGLLHGLVPDATAVALLTYPQSATLSAQTSDLQQAAGALGLDLHVVPVRHDGDFEQAFARLVQQRVGGLIVLASSFLLGRRELIVELAARHSLPAIYEAREFATAGGLVSYGTDNAAVYRQVGIYVGRILNGELAADLPVVQPTKFELVINRKTADALGLHLPPMLLALADEVIE